MRTQEQDERRGLRTATGVVNGDGTISSGVGFTVTRQGAGSYLVRFQGYRALRSVIATPLAGSFIGASNQTATPGTVQVLIYSSSATASDGAFNVTVDGWPL